MSGTRILCWQNCHNVRDLGGLLLAGGKRVRRGIVVRADSLDRLSEEGWRAALEYGVKTIIDLRSSGERQPPNDAFAARIERIHVPLLPEDAVTAVALYHSASIEQTYAIMLDRCRPKLALALAAAAHAKPGIIVHCQAGRDRTGLVIALILAAVGATLETIVDDYGESHKALAPLYRRLLEVSRSEEERRVLERELSAGPEPFGRVLGAIERAYGSIAAYIDRLGIETWVVDALRAKLVESCE